MTDPAVEKRKFKCFQENWMVAFSYKAYANADLRYQTPSL